MFEVDRKHKPLIVLQYVFFLVVLLYWAKPLLIPLSVALLVSFILYPFCRWLERHKIARMGAIGIGLIVFLGIIGSIFTLLSYQFSSFMREWPALKTKFNTLVAEVDLELSTTWMRQFIDQEEGLVGTVINYLTVNVIPQLPKTIYQSSISLVLLILIPIYVALILYYREVLVSFLYHVFPSKSKKYIKEILPGVIITYYNFIKGMGLVYLIVGILNSIGLFLLGVPNPLFFGFVASILTFIPYVGITLGALLPMAVSWLKYDSAMYPVGVIIVFVIVQVLEANVIFPLAVSNKLKINALITLVVIIGGGIIWGPLGMILFLPFAAILKLVADQVQELKPVAILFGSTPDLKTLDQ